MMRDPYIEDISCDGVGIPVYIFHNDPLIGEIPTNVVFTSDEELDSFVMKLAQRAGRYVSAAEPLLDATLPDGSRIQITFGREISRRGSNFTIRKFRKEPFTPIKLLELGTVDLKMLSYLWLLIEEGKSMLISGGTATGKSFTKDSLLIVRINGKVKVVKAEELWNLINSKEIKIKDHFIKVPTKIEVLSLDKNNKLAWKRIKAVIRHKDSRPLVKIKTDSSITVTTIDHNFVKLVNNKLVCVKASELKVNDTIAIVG